MDNYKTLKEKKDYFDNEKSNFCVYENIDSFEELKDVISLYQNKNNFIFRGSKEAQYKILSQLQLQWIKGHYEINKGLYNEYVNECINTLKNTSLFKIKSKSNGIDMRHADFYALYMLQHYGFPTPLVDFTQNIDVGLFFMTDNLIVPNCYESEIDKYSSLYVIDRSHSYFVSYNAVMENGELNADEMLEDHFKLYPEDRKRFLGRDNPYTYNKVSECGSGLILDRGFFHVSSSFFGTTTFGGNSERQERQEGVFVLNTQLEKSLEHYYYEWYKSYPLIKCYNVNKNLTGKIKKYLDEKGITHESVYLRGVISSEVNAKMIAESGVLTLEQYFSATKS